MNAISPAPVLSGQGIVKKFPGVLALDRVDFDLHAGEVHGLIGENGAGKTTLMHILAGAQQPTEGEILLDGQPVHFANTREALDQRICIVYQEVAVDDALLVGKAGDVSQDYCRRRQPSRRRDCWSRPT